MFKMLSSLYIAPTPQMGNGVFTSKDIKAGTVVEISPVIVMSREERTHLDKTKLHDYIFEWGEENNQCCMALGFVAIYNHSFNANCEYEMEFDRDRIRIVAVKAIKKGKELFINYNGTFNDRAPLWFKTSEDR